MLRRVVISFLGKISPAMLRRVEREKFEDQSQINNHIKPFPNPHLA
jgi:hypothetical protein